MTASFDLAIVGSGFAGSLLAMIARRLGKSVVLLERGRHPRFAIGESSTPLANLLLEQLALRYELPAVAPLSKFGSWQRELPAISCGLKRGFSFFHHVFGQKARTVPDHANQLLVAASSRDPVADTHWYRPEFDAYLARQAQASGTEYFEEVHLSAPTFLPDGVELEARWPGHHQRIRASFLLDATAPRGFLHRNLSLPENALERLGQTEALFTHFREVRPLAELGVIADGENPPFPIDDAAVHHVFDGGWIWVLRFNNGLTSAGVAATRTLAEQVGFRSGAAAWQQLLARLPTVQEQFHSAVPVLEYRHLPQLSFCCGKIVGPRWALLPSAAGFVDPLLSTGFALTLLGVSRLAALLEQDWSSAHFEAGLRTYAGQTQQELFSVEHVVAALYRHMADPALFNGLTLLYFAAVSFEEISQRLHGKPTGFGFLLHDHPQFGPAFRVVCEQALHFPRAGAFSAHASLLQQIRAAIEPIDVTGLADFSRRNWYELRRSDLCASAPKLGLSRAEMEERLDRSP